MKTYLYCFVLLLAVSSCRTLNVPDTRTPAGPYVQLKTGQKYEGTSAQRSNGMFVKDKIVLGDTSFKTRDVAFYSTGGATFANVGRKTFASQVADGKVNLFKYEYISTSTSTNASGGTTTTSSKQIKYYIQKKEGEPIQYLTYRNLTPMLTSNTPEFDMLERYRKTRVVSRSLGYGSLVLLAGGILMISSGSTASQGAGAGVAGLGVGALLGYFGVSMANTPRLLRAVLIADKTKARANHHRVE